MLENGYRTKDIMQEHCNVLSTTDMGDIVTESLKKVLEKMNYNISIVGATGAVGRQLLESLYKRNFPFENITLLASKKSEGKKLNLKRMSMRLKI